MRIRTAVLASGVALVLALPAAAQADPLVNEPPECSASTTTYMWPPNHKFKTVTSLPTATDPDTGEGTPEGGTETLVAGAPTVMQDEPTNGTGDGDTAPDARVLSDGTLQVRSERAGTGDGRYYSVSITFTDSLGQSVTCTNYVVVPHDKSQVPKSNSKAKGKAKGRGHNKPLGNGGALYDSFV